MPSGCSTTPRMWAWNTAAIPESSSTVANHWSGMAGFAWSTIRWNSQLPGGALKPATTRATSATANAQYRYDPRQARAEGPKRCACRGR
jgi:hypothetical protein